MSLLQSEHALSVTRGASRDFDFELGLDGAPLSLVDGVVHLSVKRKPTDRDPVIYKSSVNGSQIEVLSPYAGLVRVHFVPADTQNAVVGAYVFDLWVVLPNDLRYPIIPPSPFHVTPTVTVF